MQDIIHELFDYPRLIYIEAQEEYKKARLQDKFKVAKKTYERIIQTRQELEPKKKGIFRSRKAKNYRS